MIVVHCFVSDQKKFSNCPHYEGWYFLNVDHARQGSYLMKSETWGTHLGNPANAVIGGGGECKFPKISPLLPALFSKLSREKHSRYFDPPQKRFFQLFLLKKFLTLETSRGILGLGTEWKICRKCGKMFWAGDNRCEPCQATLPCIQFARPLGWEYASHEPHCQSSKPDCRLLALSSWRSHSTSLQLFVHLYNEDNNSV